MNKKYIAVLSPEIVLRSYVTLTVFRNENVMSRMIRNLLTLHYQPQANKSKIKSVKMYDVVMIAFHWQPISL